MTAINVIILSYHIKSKQDEESTQSFLSDKVNEMIVVSGAHPISPDAKMAFVTELGFSNTKKKHVVTYL